MLGKPKQIRKLSCPRRDDQRPKLKKVLDDSPQVFDSKEWLRYSHVRVLISPTSLARDIGINVGEKGCRMGN